MNKTYETQYFQAENNQNITIIFRAATFDFVLFFPNFRAVHTYCGFLNA